jgi:hypothetical protein
MRKQGPIQRDTKAKSSNEYEIFREVGIKNFLSELRRETFTMIWPYKSNGQNKDTEKDIRSKI